MHLPSQGSERAQASKLLPPTWSLTSLVQLLFVLRVYLPFHNAEAFAQSSVLPLVRVLITIPPHNDSPYRRHLSPHFEHAVDHAARRTVPPASLILAFC
jgi:hypothetical protein